MTRAPRSRAAARVEDAPGKESRDLHVPEAEKIVRLAARGDGVTASGRFVPWSAPGDTVGTDGELLKGPEHVPPLCQHFGICGGCQLQHVSEKQLEKFVRERVLLPLAHLGIEPGEVMPVHLSPAGARRRTAMRATRTNGEVRIGYNALAQYNIVNLAECPVLAPELFALVPPLRQFLAPYLKEGSAIGIAMTLTDTGIDLLLSNLKERGLPAMEGLAAFAREQHIARLSLKEATGTETVIELAPPTIRLGGVPVPLPPAAFLQATADGEAALVAAVSAVMEGAGRVADLFSGLGTFTFPLARNARLLAVDASGPAIRTLEEVSRKAGIPVTTAHRDLFRQPLSSAELSAFDGVVLDPPRAGASAQTKELAAAKVRKVAMVSCNPATFARDAAQLAKGGFRLGRVWPVGQFRWSTHVEIVAGFSR